MDKKTTKKSQVIISMGHISKASTAHLANLTKTAAAPKSHKVN